MNQFNNPTIIIIENVTINNESKNRKGIHPFWLYSLMANLIMMYHEVLPLYLELLI